MEKTVKNSGQTVPRRHKVAYASGGLASVIVNTMFAQYLTYFYTDVFGIGAAAVGTMFLASRIFDAANDPIIGLLVDRTHTRWGKSRPWFLWTAIPYGLFAVLCFYAPDTSAGWKLVFAYITYNGLGLAKTALNIPLLSIMSGMTDDPRERTILNSWRMITGQVAGAFVSFFTVYLVMWLGGGDERQGYFLTMLLYGIFCTGALLFCFFNIRERVRTARRPDISLRQSVAGLKGNWPLYLCIAVYFLNTLGMSLKNSTAIYYVKYKTGDVSLMSIVSVTTNIGIIAMLLTPRLLKRRYKRDLVAFGYLVQITGLITVWAGQTAVFWLIAGNLIYGVGAGFTTGLMNSMLADIMDYGEWKSGVRVEGFASSLFNFGEKVGAGIAGMLSGVILTAGHYRANAAVQPASALTAITVLYLLLPLVIAIICLVIMRFYDLDRCHSQIIGELEARKQIV